MSDKYAPPHASSWSKKWCGLQGMFVTGQEILGCLPTPAQMLESQINQFMEVADAAGIPPPTQTVPLGPPQAGVNEESRHHQQQADILSSALEQAINGPPEAPTQTLNTTVVIGEGLPALPKRLLQKIWANEYIDLSDLPCISQGQA